MSSHFTRSLFFVFLLSSFLLAVAAGASTTKKTDLESPPALTWQIITIRLKRAKQRLNKLKAKIESTDSKPAIKRLNKIADVLDILDVFFQVPTEPISSPPPAVNTVTETVTVSYTTTVYSTVISTARFRAYTLPLPTFSPSSTTSARPTMAAECFESNAMETLASMFPLANQSFNNGGGSIIFRPTYSLGLSAGPSAFFEPTMSFHNGNGTILYEPLYLFREEWKRAWGFGEWLKLGMALGVVGSVAYIFRHPLRAALQGAWRGFTNPVGWMSDEEVQSHFRPARRRRNRRQVRTPRAEVRNTESLAENTTVGDGGWGEAPADCDPRRWDGVRVENGDGSWGKETSEWQGGSDSIGGWGPSQGNEQDDEDWQDVENCEWNGSDGAGTWSASDSLSSTGSTDLD